MRIYTRTGDAGSTHLVGGKKVEKDDLRVQAYGDVDELNSTMGVAVNAQTDPEIASILRTIQWELFDLGSELATPGFRLDPARKQACVEQDSIDRMERHIDWAMDQCPQLEHFVIPGGSDASAALHVCRTVCRRAERLTVSLAREQTVQPEAVRYLNRLSDLLFALCRLANLRAGVKDVHWIAPGGRPVFHTK